MSGRHPANVGHLVMGLAFVGLVAIWALVQGDVVGGSDIRWLLPVPWVLAGGAGLLVTALNATRAPAPETPRAEPSSPEQPAPGPDGP